MAKDDFFSFFDVIYDPHAHEIRKIPILCKKSEIFAICIRFASIVYAVVDPFVSFIAGSESIESVLNYLNNF